MSAPLGAAYTAATAAAVAVLAQVADAVDAVDGQAGQWTLNVALSTLVGAIVLIVRQFATGKLVARDPAEKEAKAQQQAADAIAVAERLARLAEEQQEHLRWFRTRSEAWVRGDPPQPPPTYGAGGIV